MKFKYSIRAHPTRYRGVQFRSRLEARWAAFFDLVGMQWQYEPLDLVGWVPDFLLTLPRCPGRGRDCSHVSQLLVEVKPILTIPDEIRGTGFFETTYCDGMLDDPATALFGIGPGVTKYYSPSCSGDSGGECLGLASCRFGFVDDALDEAWIEAGNVVQWKSPARARAAQGAKQTEREDDLERAVRVVLENAPEWLKDAPAVRAARDDKMWRWYYQEQDWRYWIVCDVCDQAFTPGPPRWLDPKPAPQCDECHESWEKWVEEHCASAMDFAKNDGGDCEDVGWASDQYVTLHTEYARWVESRRPKQEQAA